MILTPVMRKYILHWGEMGQRWGVNRSVAQIHALLWLSDAPMPAEEIADTLQVARSNVSTSIRELQGWKLVKLTHVEGDRRDRFEARHDPWDMLLTIVEGRKRREIDPTLEMLRSCADEAEADPDTPAAVKARLRGMQMFMEQVNGWYEQMRQVPRPTLVKLVNLGARVSNFLGRQS
jgi:DNA-binding transcriptional regulator GbsR (MarR family)